MSKSKLHLDQLRNSPHNVHFGDFEKLVHQHGFVLSPRSGTSHRTYHNEDSGQFLDLQPENGKAKPYQIRQFLRAIACPVFTSQRTPIGKVGTRFHYAITATNNPNVFGASGLPAGLTVDTKTGVIAGTPTVSGNHSVQIRATNGRGESKITIKLTVNP